MTTKALPIVKNKYWIVEQDGRKIATVQASDDGVVLVEGENRRKYPSIRVLGTEHNIRFVRSSASTRDSDSHTVYDYPTAEHPYNAVYDLRSRLPLYTTTAKSRSYYAAGYYAVEYNSQYIIEFCPKKIILQRNKFAGPFKSKTQAQQAVGELTTHKYLDINTNSR